LNAYQAIHGLLSRALPDRNIHILGEALELSPDTQGLMAQDPTRVHLLPAADASLVGIGIGLALSGARPIISLSGPDALWGARAAAAASCRRPRHRPAREQLGSAQLAAAAGWA
jgi:pyruvate/2-oxoglutarate/acetoin dehydrogenase E1 component